MKKFKRKISKTEKKRNEQTDTSMNANTIIFRPTNKQKPVFLNEAQEVNVSGNQYSETNVMYFLFILLRIKGLYKFRALLAHPQEVLHKRHLVYCVRVMSVTDNTETIYQVPFV
jgi:hypothetical protein